MTHEKCEKLFELGKRRQQHCWDGYHALAEYHQGVYECEWVSPYTKTAGNVDATILVLLQDWSSDDAMRGPVDESVRLGYTPGTPTNRNLIALLQRTFGLRLEDVYATNLFPLADFERAAREFALPQIRIVQPALVMCLGLDTFNAIRKACGLPPSKRLAEAIDSPFTNGRTRVWCQAHTGARGQNNRGRARVSEDWQRMKADVKLNPSRV
jgi:uracil-DNA glycosylase